MVSLNEKRSKIRYVIQNKTEWVEDDNKFGKKMLEKMGWTSGVGLGKNENGRTEHIDMKFKSNMKGVGFVNGKYDDTWIAHSQSFDSVLEQLQQSHPTSSPSSIHNFAQTVQQTNTRFNYKKQSSGKDLSSRSNHELDCIFGRNKKNIKTNSTDNETKQQSDNDDDDEKKNEKLSDNLYVTSKQSITDYFKDKSKKKALKIHQQSETINDDQTYPVDEIVPCEQVTSDDPLTDTDNSIKKKKKKKRDGETVDEVVPCEQVTSDDPVNDTDNSMKKKKKKKRDEETDEPVTQLDESEKVKKQKKDIENPYNDSNLLEMEGYEGWNIDSSIEDIIKKKEKQKNRKK
ncbi:unnamed protein product [Adineta steineri]|uniref:G-patch domain-containing protein n=1 Tax=Adineta steineri TaxID=433720 RepID=A0A814VVB7_9BILA|nr:unnamed protein product [Adineta steineri]CAF3913566.1 unnamed protein product [Adineta steineri]